MTGPRVLVVGDSSTDAMRPVRDALAAIRDAELRTADLIADAKRLIAEVGWHPDLLVACQHWTREYTSADVLSILRLVPLVRIVCCYGPWCASDGRSGTPWPLAVRVPAAEAAHRIARELEVIAARRPPLPLTAGRDEIFAFDSAAFPAPPRTAADAQYTSDGPR